MARTPYTETEALLHALDDAEADSGNMDATRDYLRANFLPGELRRLDDALDVLSECIRDVQREAR